MSNAHNKEHIEQEHLEHSTQNKERPKQKHTKWNTPRNFNWSFPPCNYNNKHWDKNTIKRKHMQKQEAQSKKENLPWISEFMFPLIIN
jgi:hypothetical protein